MIATPPNSIGLQEEGLLEGYEEVVKWDMEKEAFQWLEEGISKVGVVIDRDEAVKRSERL